FGEHLDDLRVRAEVGGRQFAAVYEGKSGRQQFTHYFKRFGCRYLQVHVYAPSCTVYYAGVMPTPYPLTQRPPFRSSDELHDRIEEVCRRTLELCMHEHYEDCPWREQGLYAMDSRNQMLFGYYAFGESTFAQESLRLLAMSQREDGLLELCAPSRCFVTIPSFTLNFVIAVEENVRFSKDVTFARDMIPYVEKVMDAFLGRRDATGLVPRFTEQPYWNFYEWTDGLDGVFDGSMSCPEGAEIEWDAPLNGWLILTLKAAAALQRVVGNEEKAAVYEQACTEIVAALRNFWDEEKGVYTSFYSKSKGYYHYAELTQARLLCGGVPTAEQQAVMRQKLSAADNGLVTISLSQSLLKYDALLTDAAYGTFVKEEIGRIWGGMLYRGATSFWEVAEGADLFDRAGSLCHGWSAVPLYFYHRYVRGEKLDGSRCAPMDCGLRAE
ncbi:MAG: hypothetical protein IIW40_00750, partial [Clostridia bacterium]|nr:hypothetical protein [Clostridia bacterium]